MKKRSGVWIVILLLIALIILAIWILATPDTNQVIDVEGQDMIEGVSMD